MSAQLHALIDHRKELVNGARHIREGLLLPDSSAYGEALHGIDLFDQKHSADPVYAEWLQLDKAFRRVEFDREMRTGDYDIARLDAAQSELDRFMGEHPPEPSNDDDLNPEPVPTP